MATKTADFSLAGFVQMAEAKPISVFAVGPTATDSSDGSFHMAAVQGNTLVSMTMPADVSSLPKDPSAPLSFSSQAIKLVSHPLDSKPLVRPARPHPPLLSPTTLSDLHTTPQCSHLLV